MRTRKLSTCCMERIINNKCSKCKQLKPNFIVVSPREYVLLKGKYEQLKLVEDKYFLYGETL